MPFERRAVFKHEDVHSVGVPASENKFILHKMISLQRLITCTYAMAVSYAFLTQGVGATTIESLERRKEVNHNIQCWPELPNLPEWPAGGPPRVYYHNLLELCGFDRARPNVGCLCDKPYDSVLCKPELADPALYAVYRGICILGCSCKYKGRDASSNPELGIIIPSRLGPARGDRISPFEAAAARQAGRVPGAQIAQVRR